MLSAVARRAGFFSVASSSAVISTSGSFDFFCFAISFGGYPPVALVSRKRPKFGYARVVIKRPALILTLLTALNLLNYLDRFVLSSVLPLVRDELGIDKAAAGSLATVFLVGYFVTSPVFGALADRTDLKIGRKGLMATGVAVWSAATAATGLAGSLSALIGARAVVGVGEASYGTVAPTIIDDMAPPERKARWLSVFYVAIPIGSALGFAVGGILGKHFGWRSAFYAVGIPGVLAAAACLLIAEPVRHVVKEKIDFQATVKKLFAILLYRRGVLGYAAQTFAMGGFGYWAPTFLHEQYGLPLDKAGATFGAILVVAGGLGTAIGGYWTDRWTRTAKASGDDAAASRIALTVCAVSSAIAAPLAAACFFAASAGQFFALGFACMLGLFLSTSPINVALLRAVPTEARASAMALSIFSIHMLGDLWSPPLLGWLQDRMPAAIAMMGVPLSIAVSAAIWRVKREPS
jgi:MFS family permease